MNRDYRDGFDDGLQAAWDVVNALIRRGPIEDREAQADRNAYVLASNEIMKALRRMEQAPSDA